MSSSASAAPVLQGAQRPRILAVPESVTSWGPEAIELCALAGLYLDDWQQFAITVILGERADGLWSAFEAALEIPRQNGKGGVDEARELTGLFLLGERLIIHTAHEFATALTAFERMQELIAGCPDFLKRLKPRGGVTRSHGFEGIHLKGGQSLVYRTRTKGGARGFSGDCVVFDESMHIPEAMHTALLPTLGAHPNPQILYTGSAVDQQTMDNGLIAARLRARAIEGSDPRLAYLGWGVDIERPDLVTAEQAMDCELWAQANPAFGIRITHHYVEAEQRALSTRGFAVERLGVGDWPDPREEVEQKISDDAWGACEDAQSECGDPVCFVFDVTPSRSGAAIGVAGWRDDGLPHVEIVDARAGTGWVADRLEELIDRHDAIAVLYAKRSPAESLIAEIEALELDMELTPVDVGEHAQACGMLFDAVDQKKLRHLGTTELAQAIKGAATRSLGEAWVWARAMSSGNIAPLVAVTLALWGLETLGPEEDPPFDPDDYRITIV